MTTMNPLTIGRIYNAVILLGNRKSGIKTSSKAQESYKILAKQHASIASKRQDYLQKTTTENSNKYAGIRMEDLNLSGMMANQKLGEATSTCGFYKFRRDLIYKSRFYGTKVELVNRWYPSSKTCSACGHIQPMPLTERIFDCECCSLLRSSGLKRSD